MDNYPQFPLYIPSKGRSQYMITSKVLTALGVKHYIVVEPQEVEKYKNAIKKMELSTIVLELDMKFKEKYDTCDEYGLTKSTGPGPARNFAWEHSIKSGFTHHWVMDDNITCFRRFNQNERIKVSTGAIFRAMEDFTLRYKNVGMSGPNYCMFVPDRQKHPPFILNTRIYSCNFIRNDLRQRWRGRYNEDTILSLDILKAKKCTIQFNAFLQEKMKTQIIGGGNTAEFYHKEGEAKAGQRYAETGTIAKSKMQVAVHPDVSKIVFRYGRIHHYVDYTGFKKMKLIKKEENVKRERNNYGMTLKTT